MYTQISDEMKKMLEADARTFLMKLQSDTFEITSGFRKIVYQGGSSGEGLAIGTTVSASVEITMEKTEHLLTGKEFAFYLGMNVDGKEEYIPMGIFKAQKPAATDWEITLKAYDRMYDAERNYASSLHYPTDTQKVMREIEKLLGISFVTEITPVSLKKTGDSDVPFAGYTIREAIGYVAGLYGKFAIFNRAGQLEFRWYESGISIPLKKMFSFERNEQDYEVQKVVGSSDSNTSYTAGSGNHGISYSNPFLTQEIVNQIYSSKHGFSYRGGTVTFLGDCRIDPWDMLQVTDLQGNIYKILAMQITHEIDGGLTTTITAEAEEEDVEDSFSGPATKAMERTFAELLLVNKLVATKASIEYLEANYIKTSELDAVQANIETAVITNLQGKFATIEYIKANYATIGNLSAANAKIDTLEATALTASSAEIVALKTGIADINTLMFGSASGGSLITEFSNSVVSMIGDAQIKSAMIKDISADKITSGKIYTNQVEIVSQSGNLDIADNTIQIKDGKKVVRVQIGKDASGDYNIYIWDKNGKLMFDPLYGVQEDGIKKAIIRNDMISDTANISGKKIDIASLITTINEDGSSTLKASKIYVDTDKQTLDVSFENLTGSVNSATNTASAALSKVNTVEANLKTISDKVTTQGTQLTTVQGQISSKVWQQDITTAVTSLEIGGRNLLQGTKDFSKGTRPVSGIFDLSNTVGTYKVLKAMCPSGRTFYDPFQQSITIEAKTTYTLSFYAKADSPCTIFSYFYDIGNAGSYYDGYKSTTLTTYWKHYIITWTTGDTARTASVLPMRLQATKNVWAYMYGIKFEKGNKATDWTPAPEDTDSSILGLEATTKTLSTQYTSLNQTLTSLTATVNSNTTAISKKADGSTVTTLQENFTKFKQDFNGFETTVSENYATKSELSTKSDKIYAKFDGNGSSNAYCFLAELKVVSAYVNTPTIIIVDQRGYGRSEIHIKFQPKADNDPGLISITKTGSPTVYISKASTSTWWLYLKKSEPYDRIWVTDVVNLVGVTITWKCQNSASVLAGFVTASQMASYYGVDSTNGGTSGSGSLATSGALYHTTSTANQTATKFQWLVKSGTSETDFTLTDRVATLLSDKFDITALTTFKTKAQNGTETVINGGAIKTGTITADKVLIGEQANLITINPNSEASLKVPTGFSNYSITADDKGQRCIIGKKTDTYLMFCNYMPNVFAGGDEIYFKGTVPNFGSKTITGTLHIWLYDGNYKFLYDYGGTTMTFVSGTWNDVSGSVTIPSGYQTKVATYYIVGIHKSSADVAIGLKNGAVCQKKKTGQLIVNGTITADKIKVDSLQAICAKIGGFDIDSNSIKSGTWGTDNSVLVCTGTASAKSIGGSGTISGWCFTAGSTFGVTKAGALYANNVKVSGDITATSGTIGKLVINGNYLQADSGTSGNVYRMYIQKPTSASTWCFSTQYGSTTKVGTFYARADGLVYCTSLTSNGAVSAGGNITTNGSITAAGKLTATGNLELRTSGNASNILLHDDYAKYCYIRYSGARLWFLPATDSGGFELGHSASLDANTGTFYATAWGSNSSKRYKENITELTESVADRLLKIKTYHFDYKKDYGSKDMYGVIAEEVEQVHKNAVLYRNSEPDAVDYTRFIPLLIKKVQMQDKKLKNLDNMVTHLIGIAMHPEKIDYNNN